MNAALPVAVIGAGPVGLAAAAHLVERGLSPILFEKGATVGASLLEWGHVRVFSPWSYIIDAAAARLLEREGWEAPNPGALPTGREIVRRYLEPLAAVPAIAAGLKLGVTVTATTRHGLDKMSDARRTATPFELCWRAADGRHGRNVAHALIDASGTWSQPSPMGADGLPIAGEAENENLIDYGIPDVLGIRRGEFAGKFVLVVGGGHSATSVALDLLRLQAEVGDGGVLWAIRRTGLDRLTGGGLNDHLPERGAVGLAARKAMEDGRLGVLATFAATSVERAGGRLRISGTRGGEAMMLEVDRIVVATGFRPDLSILRELRIALDPSVEAPPRLAPLIDPNLHSCGTVPPHGAVELAHPEPDFYIVGSKSYGRAPTFLMATGYEQVRSVVAMIAGDETAAREVRLVLPETGACSTASIVGPDSGCCGGPAPDGIDGCCAADAKAKAAGTDGCGCKPLATSTATASGAPSGCCGRSQVPATGTA